MVPSIAVACGFPELTFSAGNGRFAGISWVPKKLEKFSSNPLAPGGPFWYITHPLRPKGARSILENRTVLKERDPAAPRNEGEPPEGTRNTMNEKLVVRCPEPARAPKNSNPATSKLPEQNLFSESLILAQNERW